MSGDEVTWLGCDEEVSPEVAQIHRLYDQKTIEALVKCAGSTLSTTIPTRADFVEKMLRANPRARRK